MVEASVLNGALSVTEPASEAKVQRPLRLLVLTPKPRGLSPGQRFRLEQWAPRVAAQGIDMDFVPFESPRLTELLYRRGTRARKAFWVAWDFTRRLRQVLRATRYDAVIIYREAALIGPAVYERLLARTGTPLLFDFDDAIWLPSQVSSVNGVFSRLHFWGKTSTTCALASGVIVGNEYLASYARERSSRVFVVPTSIELERYPVQKELARDDAFVVSWSGSLHTLQHLEHARTALEHLAKKRKVVVRVICNQPPARPFAGAENVFVPWSEVGEADAIGQAHAGIMPLPDDVYTRGKCGLKALQFMACGVPVAISPVGMNRDLIRPGENGFLPRNDAEWVECLEALASSRELRRKVGAAGRRTIETSYSAEVVAARFADAVRTVVAT